MKKPTAYNWRFQKQGTNIFKDDYDEDFFKWYNEQSNIENSLKFLVKSFINKYGHKDVCSYDLMRMIIEEEFTEKQNKIINNKKEEVIKHPIQEKQNKNMEKQEVIIKQKPLPEKNIDIGFSLDDIKDTL